MARKRPAASFFPERGGCKPTRLRCRSFQPAISHHCIFWLKLDKCALRYLSVALGRDSRRSASVRKDVATDRKVVESPELGRRSRPRWSELRLPSVRPKGRSLCLSDRKVAEPLCPTGRSLPSLSSSKAATPAYTPRGERGHVAAATFDLDFSDTLVRNIRASSSSYRTSIPYTCYTNPNPSHPCLGAVPGISSFRFYFGCDNDVFPFAWYQCYRRYRGRRRSHTQSYS